MAAEDSGFHFVGTGFQSLSVELGFWIPIVSEIPDSKAQDSGFHKQKFPDFLTWGRRGAESLLSGHTKLCCCCCLFVSFFWISSWSREDHAHGLSVYSWLAFPSTISIFLIGCMLSQFSRQLRFSSPRFSRSTRKHTARIDPLWRLKQLQSCPWYYCRFWRLLWPRLLLNTAL